MFDKKQLPAPDETGRQGPTPENSRSKEKFVRRIIRRAVIGLGILAVAAVIACLWGYLTMIRMPGKSHLGPLPPLTSEQTSLRDELLGDVRRLAGQIGPRNIRQYSNLSDAVDFIETSLVRAACKVRRQNCPANGKTCFNIETEFTGTKNPEQIIIIGAHYDTVPDCPGANDNASGVAAALALARRFARRQNPRTLRFVFFANEEPPFSQTDQMGSLVYAKDCRKKNENIVAMLSLETIGYYTDAPASQHYPLPFGLFYPSTGNFLGFVSDISSRKLLHTVIASFRTRCRFPSQGGAVPKSVPGITWSDQWSFWMQGYRAVMLTDTAPFRYPYYHTEQDTPDKIDYSMLARVVSGLEDVVVDLAASPEL